MEKITCLDEKFYQLRDFDWEEWRDVVWYEWHYKVSNFWRVLSVWRKVNHIRSWTRTKRQMLLKIRLDHKWYCIVKPCIANKQRTIFVHKIVMLAFKPEWRKETINHIDWNPVNNCLENLERATYSENHRHSFDKLWRKSGTYWYTWALSTSSKMVYQYTNDKKFIGSFHGGSEAARQLWLHPWWIRNCCTWRSKSAYWYFWSYKKLDG